jgi:hypothetical protein
MKHSTVSAGTVGSVDRAFGNVTGLDNAPSAVRYGSERVLCTPLAPPLCTFAEKRGPLPVSGALGVTPSRQDRAPNALSPVTDQKCTNSVTSGALDRPFFSPRLPGQFRAQKGA